MTATARPNNARPCRAVHAKAPHVWVRFVGARGALAGSPRLPLFAVVPGSPEPRGSPVARSAIA
jgi:hypothetical protein